MMDDLAPLLLHAATVAGEWHPVRAGALSPVRHAVFLHDYARQSCRSRLAGITALHVLGHSLVAVLCFIPGVLFSITPFTVIPAFRRFATSYVSDGWEEIEAAATKLAPHLPLAFSRPLSLRPSSVI
jgi:hypothetical protein